jgi:histidinol-phosphate/aromatic aminotransferase/cobyric acid decarboxylase-like protein
MTGAILQSDPKAGYLAHKREIDEAVRQTLDSGRYILGEQAREFEREFADYLGAKRCVGVGSGTDALHLALRAAGLEAGDVVITAAHTAVATVVAIEMAAAPTRSKTRSETIVIARLSTGSGLSCLFIFMGAPPACGKYATSRAVTI